MSTSIPADRHTTDRHTYELTIISQIAQALNGTVDINQAMQTTLGLVADLLELETGWIWLLNEASGAAYLAAAQNLPPALEQNPARLEGSCYCLDSYRSGDMGGAANINVVSCSRLKNLVDDTGGLTYHASVPLYARSTVDEAAEQADQAQAGHPERNPPHEQSSSQKQLGILNVASNDWRELSSDDLRLLHTVGDMLGIAVERARLYERSQELGAVAERNRLAREIHDTLAQGFAAISLQLDAADALLESELGVPQLQEKLKGFVSRSTQIAQENLAEARRSVMDLRATPLEGRTLAEALANLAQQIRDSGGVQITVRSTGSNIPLTPAIETGLFRIAQEAVTNICNHAHASRGTIQLAVTPQQITLMIQDDGAGFELAKANPTRFGITGMNERAKLLGGSFLIESAAGQGTSITVKVPR